MDGNRNNRNHDDSLVTHKYKIGVFIIFVYVRDVQSQYNEVEKHNATNEYKEQSVVHAHEGMNN